MTAFAFSPGNLGGECIKALSPKAAKLVEPRVNILEGLRAHGIDAARTIGADFYKPALAQYSQVLRHSCLRNAELSLDHCNDTSGILFPCRKKLENTASNRIAENVERMYGPWHVLNFHQSRTLSCGLLRCGQSFRRCQRKSKLDTIHHCFDARNLYPLPTLSRLQPASGLPQRRWTGMPNPIIAWSQPTPTAPGPN